MEMTYDGSLVMPSSYAVIDEDEMMYLEGGKTYKGAKALQELSNMVRVVSGHATSIVALGKVLTGGLVASGTGIGCAVH